MQRSRFLVTGGAGFIGSHLCRRLIEDGHHVSVLDDLSTGCLENLKGIDPVIHVGDVRRGSDVAKASAGCQGIFHLASKISVTESIKNPDDYQSVIEGGTKTLREICGDTWITMASTCAVYGSGVPANGITNEDTPCEPMSPYAEYKYSAEQWVDTSLRFFNVYGAGQRPDSDYSGVISLFCKAASTDRKVRIYGDGLQTRDFVHVNDVVQALIMSVSTRYRGSVNVGSGVETSINDLVKYVEDVFDTRLDVTYSSARDEIRHICADMRNAFTRLGFRPEVVMADGLKDVKRG